MCQFSFILRVFDLKRHKKKLERQNFENLEWEINAGIRYYAFGDYMFELMDMLRLGISEGQTNHNVSMAGVLQQVSCHNNEDKNNTIA